MLLNEKKKNTDDLENLLSKEMENSTNSTSKTNVSNSNLTQESLKFFITLTLRRSSKAYSLWCPEPLILLIDALTNFEVVQWSS